MKFLLRKPEQKGAHGTQSHVGMKSVNDYGRPSLVAQRNREIKEPVHEGSSLRWRLLGVFRPLKNGTEWAKRSKFSKLHREIVIRKKE
jgi:hypothetical protein